MIGAASRATDPWRYRFVWPGEDELGLGGRWPHRLGGAAEPPDLFHGRLYRGNLRPDEPFQRLHFPWQRPTNFLDKRTYKGWFLGAGDEYAIGFLPCLFWKTEYRFSEFDVATNPLRDINTGLLTGDSVDSKKFVHTVRSELVYRFNWGGPARY
jgi:outer membrane immunogenic protein